MSTPTIKATVDVRNIIPRERHPLIFDTFRQLTPGEAMLLVNDHDPKPLGSLSGSIFPARCREKAMDARREVQRMVIPFASFATPQTRFLAATRRDGPDSAHRGVAGCLWRMTPRRSPCLALHPNPGRRAGKIEPDRLPYQFQAELGDFFSWDYLEQGPEVWQVRIGRTTPCCA